MDVGQVIASVAGQGVLLAVLGYLIRALISNSLSKENEQFKSRLLLDNDEFKSKLAIEAHRQTTVFSQLHGQRAKVIAEIYALLATAAQAMTEMVAPFQPVGADDPQTLMHRSAVAINALRDKFAANRIWFSEPTCEKVDAMLIELRHIHNTFNVIGRGGTGRPEHVNTQVWAESWQRVEELLPGLRGALETDFRGILGVENSPRS
jgi:hypothetical protein